MPDVRAAAILGLWRWLVTEALDAFLTAQVPVPTLHVEVS